MLDAEGFWFVMPGVSEPLTGWSQQVEMKYENDVRKSSRKSSDPLQLGNLAGEEDCGSNDSNELPFTPNTAGVHHSEPSNSCTPIVQAAGLERKESHGTSKRFEDQVLDSLHCKLYLISCC